MSPAPAASIISLSRWQPHQEARPAPTGCYACVARLLCFDHDRNAFTSRNCRALLSPGDPYLVVFPVNLPPNLAAVYDVVNFSAPLSWCGIACRLVRVRIGLPVAGSQTPRPFQLLALLPLGQVEDVPPFIRLGAEFLHANRASVELSSSPCAGKLVIPYP
jgi:hypothetical protein